MDKEKVEVDDRGGGSVVRGCCNALRRAVPHALLVLAYLLYLAIGGLVFSTLESSQYNELSAQEQVKLVEANRTKLLILEAYHNVSMGISKPEDLNISMLLDSLIDTVDHPDWKAGRKKTMAIGRDWSFPSAALFSMTTITTIGYGDLVPETLPGRIFCVAYSALGVPFSFFLLADIGQVLAIAFIKLVRCCRTRNRELSPMKNSAESDKKNAYPKRTSRRLVPRYTEKKDAKANLRRSVKPDVTMRHLKSIRTAAASAAADNPGERRVTAASVRNPPPQKAGQRQTDDKSIEMTELEVGSADQAQLNTNNCALDHSSQQGCYDTSPSTTTTVVEGKKENLQTEEANGKCSVDEVDSGEEEVIEYHEYEVPILLVLGFLVSYMLISGYAFMVVEGWDYGTSVYFIFITLTTIGFGDIVADQQYTPEVFFFCLIFTIFGLAVTSMCIALTQDTVLRGVKGVWDALHRRLTVDIDESEADTEQGHTRSSQG